MLMENYEKIVKNIIRAIQNGTISSRNARKLQNYTAAELFNVFMSKYNLQIVQEQTTPLIDLNTMTLTLVLKNHAMGLVSIYLEDVGDIDIMELEQTGNKIVFNILFPEFRPAYISTAQVKYFTCNATINEIVDNIDQIIQGA